MTVVAVGLFAGLVQLLAPTIGLADTPASNWREAALFAIALSAVAVGLVLAYVPPSLLSPRAVARKIAMPKRDPSVPQRHSGAGARARYLHLYLVGAGFLLGLAIRVAFTGHYGTQDPLWDLFVWGRGVTNTGLAGVYESNYFPVQYQVFGSVFALAEHAGIRPIVAFKLVNLGCDLGLFTLIVVLLQRWAVNPAYALVYWLAPYVAGLNWLSYVDFQLGLFALLAVVVVSFSNRPTDFFIAGIPLGMTVLMKPQSIALFAMLGLFVLARAVLDRRIVDLGRWALLFIAPIAMFGVYSLYFWLNGHSLTFLLTSYINEPSLSPSLSANMPNIWHIVGNFYREGDNQVSDVTGLPIYHWIATLGTVAILTAFAFAIARTAGRRSDGINMLLLFAVGGLVTPMTMTRAHENHLFLGAMFGSLVMVIARDWRLAVALSGLLLVQFANIFALYGFDDESRWDPLGTAYTYPVQLAVAVVATAAFAILAFQLMRVVRSPLGTEQPALPDPHPGPSTGAVRLSRPGALGSP
jgi:hypothetical protein